MSGGPGWFSIDQSDAQGPFANTYFRDVHSERSAYVELTFFDLGAVSGYLGIFGTWKVLHLC